MQVTTFLNNIKHCSFFDTFLLFVFMYEGRPINKLQNGIIQLIFKI